MSKRVKNTFLRKLWRSLDYSFRESRWRFMARGTYENAFRKFVGNRKVKQLQYLPFCRRGWRMTWRKKEGKGWVCAPQSSVPPAEEVEKFGGLDLTGLPILGASERPQRAFWPVQFPLLLSQMQERSQKPQWFFASFLLPSRLTGSRSISATKVKPAYGTTESPRPAQHACQCRGKTPEHRNFWPI